MNFILERQSGKTYDDIVMQILSVAAFTCNRIYNESKEAFNFLFVSESS